MASRSGGVPPAIRALVVILVVLGVLIVVVPAVLVVGVVAAGALTGGILFTGNQHAVAASRVSVVRSEVGQLGRRLTARREAGEDVTACGSEADARARLRPGPVKEPLSPGEPADRCLLDLGVLPEPLYGRYWVEVGGDGRFSAHGLVDLDDDGVPLHLVLAEGGARVDEQPPGAM